MFLDFKVSLSYLYIGTLLHHYINMNFLLPPPERDFNLRRVTSVVSICAFHVDVIIYRRHAVKSRGAGARHRRRRLAFYYFRRLGFRYIYCTR